MRSTIKLFVTLFSLLTSVFLHAQGVQTSQRMIAPVIVGSTQSEGFSLNGYQDLGSRAVVTLGVNPFSEVFIGENYTVDATLALSVTYANGSTGSLTRPFHISYSPFDLEQEYTDKSFIILDNVTNLSAEVISMNVVGLPVTNTLPDNAYIEITMMPVVMQSLAPSSVVSNVNIVPQSQNCDGAEEVYDFLITWDVLEGAVEYQLEWTFINDYGTEPNQYLTAAELPLDFKHNSTRISTTNNTYTIPNLFDHGYLICRVRAFGSYSSSPDQFYFTQWSDDPSNVDVAESKIQVNTPHEESLNWQVTTSFAEEGKKKEVISYFDGTLRNRQSVTRLNSDKNVIVGETAYDYQGRPAINILPVPVKLDGCTQNEQLSPLRFYPNFNQVVGAENALVNPNPSLFDESVATCGTPDLTFSTSSGAAMYYSENNPDQEGYQAFLPDANGKVYSQVVYTPDNTGRISSQGGIGQEFGINSGHATKYLYGTPVQIELDRLFGSEVGYASHYQKNAVIDPNGQASISYLDQEGRVIATALAGESPDNLIELESGTTLSSVANLNVTLFDSPSTSIDNSNVVHTVDETISFSKTFVVTYPAEYSFNYNLEHSPLSIDCIDDGICINCAYDLEIHLIDECGEDLWLINGESPSIGVGYVSNESGLVFNANCVNNPTQFESSKTITLGIGAYTISKVLKINEAARDYYLNQYLTNQFGNCVTADQAFIDIEMDQNDPSDCEVDCQSCLESLGSADDYVANGGTYDGWYFHYSECQEMCEVYDPCVVPFEMMIADVCPGGQYANYDFVQEPNGGGLDYTYAVHTSIENSTSLLDVDNNLPSNINSEAHWRLPLFYQGNEAIHEYRDAYNARTKVYVTQNFNGEFNPRIIDGVQPQIEISSGAFYVYPEQLLNVEDFVDRWDASWAKSLITYHPEYCYYQECISFYNYEENQAINPWSNRAIDSLLYNAITLDLAAQSNLISLNNVNNLGAGFTLIPWTDQSAGSAPEDVFITHSIDFGDFGGDMLSKYNNYIVHNGVTYTMPQVAALMNRAQNLFGNGINIEPWMIAFGQPISGISSQENEELLTAEWNSLSKLYLATKNEIVMRYFDFKAMTCDDCLCFNDCIGKDQWNFFETYPLFYTQPSINGPIYDLDQPCGLNLKMYFKSKQPRWISATDVPNVEAALGMTMEDYAYNMYVQTGLCPVDFGFQNLLSELANQEVLNSTTEISLLDYSSFGGLIYALQDFYADQNSTTYDWGWTALQTGNTLMVQISDLSESTVVCNLQLLKVGAWDWDDVDQFRELTFVNSSNGTYTFYIQAGVIDQVTGELDWKDIQGSTSCFPLGQCHFEDRCEPTEIAIQTLEMLNWIQGEGTQGIFGSFTISNSTSSNFGQTLQNYIGGASNITSAFQPSSGLLKVGCPGSGYKIYLELLSSEPALSNWNFLANADYFSNIESEFENNFSFEVWTNNVLVCIIHAKATYEQNEGIQPIQMGICGDPTNLFCQGEPFENFNDLENWLGDILQNNITDPDQSLYFTSEISEHFLVEPENYQLQIEDQETLEFVSLIISGSQTEGLFSDCQIELSLTNDGFQNFGIIESLGNMEVYGETGPSGYHTNFRIPVVLNNGTTALETYIYGSSCMDVEACTVDCEDGKFDDDGIDEEDEEGKYEIDTSVSTYFKYEEAVEVFNTSNDLNPGDVGYIELISYSVFYKNGCYHTAKEYILKLTEFKPGVDDFETVESIVEFSINYGNYTNPKEEWQRYLNAVDKYNIRASDQGLIQLEAISDSLFFNSSFADSLDSYLNYLEIANNLYFAPASLEDYYYWLVYDYSLTAECEDLYNYYLISYSLWAGNQTNNQTCETFSPKDEMVSLKTFESLGYCEDSLGMATFQAYISSIQQSADCLPELPQKLKSLDGQLKMTSKDCQTVYMNYKKLMYSYHHSAYYGGDINRELEVVDSYEVFEAEGYCECFESYMRYLTPYLTYHYAAAVSPAVSIVDWEGCNQTDWESNPCSRDSYREYEEIIQSFNEYCELYHIRDLQISRVSYEVFFSNELCDCLDDWAAYLQSLMDAKVSEIPEDEQYKLNLDKFCENEAPCEPEVSLLEDFPEFPIADYIDPCLQGQTNMAYGNGVLAWQSYIALLTQEFVSSYNAHCLQPTESLNESYVDKEHHYTLYYYDQVGNLIKTIPPAGVQRLDIDSDLDELAQRIDLDRENHTHTIFTNHLMATKYEYNSLNQLVRQYLPDHDPMDISEVYQTNGLPVNLVVTEIQMVDAANGWLVGNIPFELFENFASDFGRVYKTTDGGSTWTRVNYILGANLKSIVMPTESIGFAVGEKGALVKTIDGGLSWFEIASEELIQTDLNQIIYLSESSIYAFGDKGKIYHSTNGGFSWSSIAVSLSETDNIISATVHGPYIYLAVSVLVNDFRKSKIFKFDPLQATIVEQKIKTNYLFGSNKGGNGIVSMHGADGQLFLLKNWIWNGTNAADLVCVDTYLKSNIYDSYFLDENKGVIISGDNPESAKLYATYNAGQTWEMVSPANHFYKELVPYYDETGGIKKLIGLRNNGELDRILFETSCGVVPMYLDGISNIKTLDTHFSNSLNAPFPAVAATTTEAKFTFEINNVMPTWLSLSTGNYADVTIKYEQPEEMSGLLVQTDGALKAFYIDGAAIVISSSSATGVVKCIANPSNDFGYTISTNGTIQSWNLNTVASLNGSTISSTASVPISYWSDQNSPADLSFRNGKLVVSNNKGEFMEIPLLANGNFGSPSQIKSIGFISELSQIETNSEIIAAAGANGDVFVKSDIDFIKANNKVTADISSIMVNLDFAWLGLENGNIFKVVLPQFNTTDPASNDNNLIWNCSLTSVAGNSGNRVNDFVINGNSIYALSNNGKVWKSPVVGGTGYVGLQTGTNRNIICGTTKGTTNQLYLGCADGRILKAVTNSIVPVDNINVCSIKDIHFNEVGSGVIVETNGRIRYTYNIANGWEIPSLPSANNIPSWNAGIIAEDDQIRIVGESIIAKIEENEVVTVGGNLSASFIGVEHIETSDKFVYVGNAGSQGEIRIETNGTFAVNSYAGKPFSECSLIPGANRIGAVYSTGINQSLAIIEINSNSILDNQIALSCSGIRDIAFNDMMHFMAVGDNGLWKAFEIVLTSDLNSPDYTGASISAATDLNPVSTVFSQQSDVTGFDFSAIAYSGSHKGILGANYNGGIEHCTRRFEEMSGEYSTLFYYDKLGRIVLSQNSKQQGNVTSNENQKYYSYTLYDGLGRVYEAGVKAENATSEIQFRNIMGDYVNNTYNPNVINDVNLIEWLETGSMEVDINNDLVPDAVSNPTRTEITRSLYDEAVDDVYTTAIPSDFVQSNLRKRVSAIYYMETWVDNMEIDELPLFNSATYYSYDIHGNVNTLIQDNPAMTLDNVSYAQQRFKRMDYVYDLISGNVHQMSYQSGKSDAWHHHYTYDADNRIKEVFTSKQPNPIAWTSYTSGNPGWDLDAKYFYYEHGPLARVELGDNQVQGVDYAYTLQGWLKGTNSNSLDANRDMGQDGNANNALNQYIARDAYSYSLGYYEGDYESVNAGSVSPLPQWYAETDGGDIDNQSNDLWNGNIGIMQTTLMRSDNQGVLTAENLGMAYNYDQLNRLKDAKGYLDFNYTNNAWESTGESAKFKNSFTFDANGNINSQKRYQFERTTTNPIAGTDVLVDDLVYKYHESDPTSPTASRRISNRLYSVNDAVADLSYPDDIHDMGEYMYPTQTNPTVQVNGDNNYIYSKIGELVGDAQEEIDEIVWRVDSKIKEVKRSASSDKKSLKFEYDPMGNRIAKYVYDGEMLESSTFYVRDAQGTTIAVYDEKMITEVVNSTSITTVKYALAERHIYGSSRLGMDTTEVVVPQNEMVIAPTSETTITRHLKKKLYELSNHLGNVLTVISDMKVPVGNEATGVLEYYNPHIISVTDYSPFGVALSARTWSEQEYRFSFNGKEHDGEIAGTGNWIHFEFREYDPRIVKMKSIDPKNMDYAWQSPYAYHRNSPIRSFDYLGLGDPPTIAYHNTKAEYAVNILEEGFVSGKSGWNYFMTDPSGAKAGSSVASEPVQLQCAINIEGAQTITYEQWRGFFNEAKAEMELTGIENSKLTTDQLKSLNAIRNQKAVQFMNQAGGDTFIIEAEAGKSGQKFIVMTDKAVKSKVVIQSIPKGHDAVLSQMEKTSASSGKNFSRSNVSKNMFRYGKMALRLAGQVIIVEGVIWAMQQKAESTQHYVERRSLNGYSPFSNWMLDTYSDVGLYYWYKYSIDLN